MPSRARPLHGWTVLSLRPRGQHAGLRAAAARMGASTLALSPLAIESRDDPAAGRMLAAALACEIVLFTSPNAVRSSLAARAFAPRRRQAVLAVGDGTRRALARYGIHAEAPARMDSEGLLALPPLQAVAGKRIGLVTGEGGRNRLAPALRARGAEVLRADAYARVPVSIPPARWRVLADALGRPAHLLLALSSGDALQALLAQAPAPLHARLRRMTVSAASERLAAMARERGFTRVAGAANARPAALLRAAIDAFV